MGEDGLPSFEAYVAARMGRLRQTAYLLCGDWYRAEDLVQDTFGRLFVHWRRASRADNLDAYARRVLVNVFLTDQRRPWRGDVPVDVLPERIAAATSQPSAGEELLAALADLGASQRAVVVLRYWEDLSVEQTARTLGCSVGNVKSQSARGLARLRTALGRATPESNDLEVP
jgi:RNA polymerase sigma-70 factor (sigma-E family)